MKKALKIVLIVIGVIALFFLACFLMMKQARSRAKYALGAENLCNLVSAGDIALNVPMIGSNTAAHTVIAIPGSGDYTFAPAMREFAKYIPKNVRLVSMDRPGYGISDCGKEDMTAEYVVECMRTAAQKAGLNTPYVLMPHSLGGIYATYWESKYPEEIEGVLFLDSVYDPDESLSEEPSSDDRMMQFYVDTGIYHLLFKTEEVAGLAALLPEELQEYGVLMREYRPFNSSLTSESMLIDENVRKAWDAIQTNEIPKIYVSTETSSKEDMEAALRFLNAGREPTQEQLDNAAKQTQEQQTAAYQAKRAEYMEKLGNCELVTIPSSHFVYLQKPKETADALKELLAKLK